MFLVPEEKILVIEDENITALEIQTKLEGWGYEVVGLAGSGEEAIQISNEKGTDLILADIVLRGDMDGIDAVERISQRFDVPVIYLTAHADADTFERAKLTRPSGYVIKPFDDTELKYSIEIALLRRDFQHKTKEFEEKERMSTVKDFMLSSTPALTSQIRIEDTASFLREFAKFFEDNMKVKFKRELKVQHDFIDDPEYLRKVQSEYIAWMAHMFSNLGYSVETSADEFRVVECLWGPKIKDNKIYCLMCKAMAELTLKWASIDGKIAHSYLLGPNPPRCKFSIEY
ncbi:methanogen output domain 1-containing protein [Methanobacterium sp. SMA-27]|uniref:methanogen output domain 1-containing protein n=1 Tax=Methanobacterium sp. SMA-27 TaxID=1495336 RepID=UPI00064F25CE|nr:methanogen output domain 1-containing protein [Methanobacterium sp. SMA-27]